ncbi:CO/xanthine dehydrogenase Mo-binding subunit [Bradyrhizobium sp. F1.13.4]
MTAAAPEPKANMGRPVPRYDAAAKVTGRATYASDMPLDNPAYAFLVTSAIAKGRIDSFDLDDARQVRGVIDIVTHENAPKLKESKLFSNGGYAGTTIQPLKSADIAHDGQIIAVVIAESYEAAREAANRVKVSYTAVAPSATFDSPGTTTAAAKGQNAQFKEDPEVGDFAKAFDAAEVKLTASYETPTQHHNPMELFTTSCAWMGDELVIYEGSQYVYGLKERRRRAARYRRRQGPCRQSLCRWRLWFARLDDAPHRHHRRHRQTPEPADQARADPRSGFHHRDPSRRDAP